MISQFKQLDAESIQITWFVRDWLQVVIDRPGTELRHNTIYYIW